MLKKSLGQNLLRDQKAAKEIVAAAGITSDDAVLEIGPGEGVLTYYILESKPKSFVAVEIDNDLAACVRGRFRNIKVETSDFMDFDFSKYEAWPEGKRRIIISNLPYYLTSKILEKITYLDEKYIPDTAVLMVQEEFGERIIIEKLKTGKTKIRSSLALLLNNRFNVTELLKVTSGNFYPRPEVDSVVLKFEKLPAPVMRLENTYKAFVKIRKIFSQKRKKMSNALSRADCISSAAAADMLNSCGIDPFLRPEDLGFQDWEQLLRDIS